MSSIRSYLFKSHRLGFREWLAEDAEPMSSINMDAEVMAYFPRTQTRIETQDFITNMRRRQTEKGFCYFAVDRLDNGAFIGFIGLSEKDLGLDFMPCVDIGWRLKKEAWGSGLATEGAKACLAYGFDVLKLEKIMSLGPSVNKPSERVMQKIGMHRVKNFIHPRLLDDARLRDCVLYEITRPGFNLLRQHQ